MDDNSTDPGQVAAQLTALGVPAGASLMVHASMRKLGPIVGGATGLIEAIRTALGADGTMLMMLAADDDEPFDRLSTEADEDIGVLAEVFRTHPGVEVSDHPACRFGAWGPAALELLEPQPLHDYYGPGSPLERLCQREGYVLRLGSDLDTVTLTHLAENLAKVDNKRRVQREYVRADSGAILVDSIDDTDGIAQWAHGDYFPQILVDFIAAGQANVGPIAQCTAELFDGQRFVDFAIAWIERELQTEA